MIGLYFRDVHISTSYAISSQMLGSLTFWNNFFGARAEKFIEATRIDISQRRFISPLFISGSAFISAHYFCVGLEGNQSCEL